MSIIKKINGKKNDKRIDTSIEGFRSVGINLTEEQYSNLQMLNMLILRNKHRQRVPVFNMVLALKFLGLLNPEMLLNDSPDEITGDSEEDSKKRFERKYGLEAKEPDVNFLTAIRFYANKLIHSK